MPKKKVVKKPENMKESMKKMFGEGFSYASEKEERFKNISWVDTGSYTLNKLINYQGRGIPAANMVEMYGASTSGKSVTALHIIRSTQEQDGIAVHMNAEGSLDYPLAKNTGVDLKKLLVVDPTTIGKGKSLVQLTMKEVMFRTEHMIRTVRNQYGADKLLSMTWDSLGGTCYEEDLDPNGPQLTRGIAERRVKRWITRIRPLVNSTNTLWFVVNQVFGSPGQFTSDTPAGGKAVGFHSEIRIKCVLKSGKEGKVFDKNGLPIGAKLHYEVVKNRVGPPWRKGFSEFIFDKEGKPTMDYYSGYANYLLERGAIERHKDKDRGKITVGRVWDGDDIVEEGDSYQAKLAEGGLIECKYMGKMLKEHPELLEV